MAIRANKRRWTWLMLLLLLMLFAGCADSQSALPRSYVLSTSGGVAFMTWNASQDGQITGSYSTTTNQGNEQLNVTGQEQDSTHLTLQIAGTSEPMSATINGPTLQTSGQGGSLIWYAGSSQQYHQLQASYVAYVKVSSDLNTLQPIEEAPPNDSYPGYYQSAVTQAQNRVNDEQASLQYIQQQQDAMTRCMALSEFSANFPPAAQDSELQLPYSQPTDMSAQAVVDRSTLSKTLAQLSADLRAAQALSLPAISGLAFPWKMSGGGQPQTQGEKQLSSLKRLVLTVGPEFPPLEQQAAQIQAQEAAIQKRHQCFG